ncbi:hypothetical protein GGI35DRAFT_484763 [Trichoderma velutinum]
MGRPRRGSARASATCVKDFTPKDHGSWQDASLGSNGVHSMYGLTVLDTPVCELLDNSIIRNPLSPTFSNPDTGDSSAESPTSRCESANNLTWLWQPERIETHPALSPVSSIIDADPAHSLESPSNLVQIYEQLSRILYALNTERPPQEVHKIDGHKWFESISCLVSSLCEITSRLQGQRSITFGGANLSPCLLLVISIVSNVIQVYEVVLENLKSSWKTPAQQLNLHEKLQILADASTMEFHLVSLRRIYDHGILDMPSKYAGQRLDKLLSVLQQCIQHWRLLSFSAAPSTEFAGIP